MLDIAWFITVHRLGLAGYRIDRHPSLRAWYERLKQRPVFASEVRQPFQVNAIAGVYRLFRTLQGTRLHDVAP